MGHIPFPGYFEINFKAFEETNDFIWFYEHFKYELAHMYL